MPNFNYHAIDNTGNLVKDTITAFDELDIEQRVSEKGYTLIKYKMLKKWGEKSLTGNNKVKTRILIEFYYRLSQTLFLGLPILSALEENAKSLPSKSLRMVSGELNVAIEAGKTLSEAMTGFPSVFEKLDLAIINLGEQTGVLPESMQDLAAFLEWKEDIKSTIKRAAIYPSIVMLVILSVIGVWVGYVLPQMAKMLIDMGVVLPEITKFVLSSSHFLQNNWFWILGIILFAIASLYIFQKTKKGGVLIHKYFLKIPVIGTIAINVAVARLSHNFSAMYKSGMNINKIFNILSDNVIGNKYLEKKLLVVHQNILAGQSIGQGFEQAGGFPILLVGAIKNGELTGTIDDAFTRLGDYFDKEVKRSVQTMINTIEPVTMVFLGGTFGIIILSIMLPLYDVIGNFGKQY